MLALFFVKGFKKPILNPLRPSKIGISYGICGMIVLFKIMCFSSVILIPSKHVWLCLKCSSLSKMILRTKVEGLIRKMLRLILKCSSYCYGIILMNF